MTTRNATGFTPVAILVLVVGIALPASLAGCAQGEAAGTIGVLNESGRSGVYYLPPVRRSQAVPLLVLLHGSGGAGDNILPFFRPLAQARRFAIVAPDSHRTPTGQFTWQVGDHPGDVSPDLTHTMNCIQWVRTHTGLVVDSSHVLIAGFSG